MNPIHFECVVPILSVTDLDASLQYYKGKLGFVEDFVYPGSYAGISRGGKGIMLCQGGQGQPGTWVWFGVNDAQALYEEYVQRGADVKTPPSNYPWALEFHVQDPDGHVLRFGSDAMDDRPYDEWVEWYAD
ncbi:MAG: VOC family protein [Armatimonadetes bacterium]|nr:VOC family protein [Armatimonadota bacterium]